METIGWIFNGDYEDRLFSNRFTNIQSTKVTQEFEYFIHLLNPDYTIFSTKTYSQKYREFLKEFTGFDLKLTTKPNQIANWCAEYDQPILRQKLQNKNNLAAFLKLDVRYIKSKDELEEGYLYKYPKSLSGGGHYLYPRNEKKLLGLLSLGETLIKEKVYKRYLDFSTLIENGKVIKKYKNFIDDYFQYKGTLIEDNFKLDDEIEQDYEKSLKLILDYSSDYKGVMSIDSFCYLEKSKKYLYPACELNIRKTMGYVAFQLKEKYFKEYSFLKLLLMRNQSREVSQSNLQKKFGDKVVMLSPTTNRFLVFIIVSNDKEELISLENKLRATFFQSI